MDDDDQLSKLSREGKVKIVQCRICKGDHWTTKCPYKDTLQPLQVRLCFFFFQFFFFHQDQVIVESCMDGTWSIPNPKKLLQFLSRSKKEKKSILIYVPILPLQFLKSLNSDFVFRKKKIAP